MEEFSREAKEQLGLVAPVKGGDEEQKGGAKTFRGPPQLVLENWPQRSTEAALNKSTCEHKARVTKTHTKETKDTGEKETETYGQKKK